MTRPVAGCGLFLSFWLAACASPGTPAPRAAGAPPAAAGAAALDATASAPPEAPVVPARPEDVATIDGLIAAFYAVVNVGPDEPRQWGRDRTLYVPWIRFVALGGDGAATVYDHPHFIADTEPMIRAGFREREIARTTRRYGNMVHIDSTYETLRGVDVTTRSRGVNSLELYWDGARWWIASVVWQSESAAFPIPAPLAPR